MVEKDAERQKAAQFEKLIAKETPIVQVYAKDYEIETDEDKYIHRDAVSFKLSSAGTVYRRDDPTEKYYYSLEYVKERGIDGASAITEVSVCPGNGKDILDYDGKWKILPSTSQARAILSVLEDYAGKIGTIVKTEEDKGSALSRIKARFSQGKEDEKGDKGR